MKYTDIPEEIELEWKDKITLAKAPSKAEAKHCTTYFARNFLGVTAYPWQHMFWRKIETHTKRLVVCTPRQIGKSIGCAVFALKAALFNTFPAGVDNKTRVGIVSATDEQSKKLMDEIRRIMDVGDDHVEKITGGKHKHYFTGQIDNSQQAANNKTAITFKNGNTIVCLPPTKKIKGHSFAYVFVDEAAFVEHDDVFFEYIEPTVSQTNGYIIMTSTPNGQQGFFFDVFDPDDRRPTHEYDRLWLHWTMINNEEHKQRIKDKKKFYEETGREKKFQQEYDALFTSQVGAYFDSQDVDNAISTEMRKLDYYKGECTMGVDFGMVNSNTAITISAKEGDTIKLLYDHVYPPGQDMDLVQDILSLMRKFGCVNVVVDDCPEGHYLIQDMENRGVPIIRMSFVREKIEKYSAFRANLRQGLIKFYRNDVLTSQMKGLQEIETPNTTRITKPSSGKDDLIDSFVMSCYNFLDWENLFDSETISYQQSQSGDKKDPRQDAQWSKMQARAELFKNDSQLLDELKLWGKMK